MSRDSQTDSRPTGAVGYLLGTPDAAMEDCGPSSCDSADTQDPYSPDTDDPTGPGPGMGMGQAR